MRYVLIAAFCFTVFTVASGQEHVSIQTIAQAKLSVLPIVCGFTDEHNKFQVVEVAGSGFFVDTFGRFVTAAHVLKNWDTISREKHTCFPVVYIPDTKWSKYHFVVNMQWFTFVSCIPDDAIDIAVCQPLENPFTSKRINRNYISPVSFDTHEWPDGTPVAFTGFPLENETPITAQGFVAGKVGIAGNDSYFDLVIDKSAWPGASGSMVYLGNGKVVGMVRATGVMLASGLTYARNASAIVDFLRKHPYVAPPKKP